MSISAGTRRIRVLLIAIALACGGILVASAQAHASATVTINPTATGADTTLLKLTGTYTCSPGTQNPEIQVTADQVQGGVNIGAQNVVVVITCNGKQQNWVDNVPTPPDFPGVWEEGTALATAVFIASGVNLAADTVNVTVTE